MKAIIFLAACPITVLAVAFGVQYTKAVIGAIRN